MKCLDWLWFCLLITVIACPSSIHGFMISAKALTVDEELLKETLPLQNGARIYQLQGLKPGIWYEVKISYPASGRCRMSVLFSVEAGGIVAITGKQEREHVIFNIVCDELLLGLPHKAWLCINLSQGKTSSLGDLKIERTFRARRRAQREVIRQQRSMTVVRELAVMPNKDDCPIEDFAPIQANEEIPSIRRPVIQANNFELKPATIKLLQQLSTYWFIY